MFNFFKKKAPIVLKKDIHAHLLPGIDDGPKTMKESIAMILLLKEMGYEQLIATPHVYSDYYPNTREKILETFAALQDELQKQAIDISITPSAEYYLEEEFESILTSNSLLPLFDQHLLVETSTLYTDPKFKEYLFKIRMHGYTPIIAHPERYIYFKEEDYASFIDLYTNNPKTLKLAVPTKNGTLFLNERDIIYCKANGSYTQIYREENNTLLITKGLHKIQASLSKEFIRIHHSYIVNLNHVVGYAISKPNSITLSDGTVLNVSRNRKKDFLDCYKSV